MGKNWLIRTRSNHILGPISKEKVLELYQNGSVKPDDEICSGNGYWFFIRETDLVEKYLLGNDLQGFNPISEAKDVLTATSKGERDVTRDDITIVGGINLNQMNAQAAAPKKPAPAPTANTAAQTPPPHHQVEAEKKKVKTDPQVKNSSGKKPPQQQYLKYLGLLGFIILFLMIYYRKHIIKSIFKGEVSYQQVSEFILSTAHAQDENPAKKKSFLSPL